MGQGLFSKSIQKKGWGTDLSTCLAHLGHTMLVAAQSLLPDCTAVAKAVRPPLARQCCMCYLGQYSSFLALWLVRQLCDAAGLGVIVTGWLRACRVRPLQHLQGMGRPAHSSRATWYSEKCDWYGQHCCTVLTHPRYVIIEACPACPAAVPPALLMLC